MPQPADLLPGGPTGIWQAIRDLQRQYKELRAARRGEGIGRLRVTTSAGVLIVETGPMPYTHIDGTTQEGIRLYREDGGLVASVQAQPTVTGVDRQSLSIYDRAANVVFSDDPVAGSGLARPYIPIRFARGYYLDWPGTASATFADLHLTVVEKQAPMAYVVIVHTNDVAGATGQVQVTVNGDPIDTPTGTIFGVTTTTVGPFALPGNHMDAVDIRVQALRSTGTGNTRCEVIHATQIES